MGLINNKKERERKKVQERALIEAIGNKENLNWRPKK